MALCVAHLDANKETAVIDALREVRPPFSPEAVVVEFAALCRSYGLSTVTGDRYGGEWPREVFGKHGILYKAAPKSKSDLYVDTLSLINSRRLDLLDHPRAINQILGLERRVARSGKDSIDHAPGQHDDLANVICGAASTCVVRGTYNLDVLAGITPDDPYGIDSWRRLRLGAYLNSGGNTILW